MKTMTKLIACAVLSLVGGLGFSLPGPDRPLPREEKVLKSLGVADDVIAQVSDLFEKGRAAARTQRAAIGVLKAQIRQALAAPNPDLKAVNALVDQKAALQASLEKSWLAEEVQLRTLVGDKVFDQVRAAFRPDRRPGPSR